MGVGLQRRSPHPGEQLGEGRIAREVAAQHQRVDEEADQRLDLAPGCGSAIGEPTGRSACPLSAPQQRLEARPGATMNRVDSWRRASRDSSPVRSGGRAEPRGRRGGRHRRPWPVGGQVERLRNAGELLPPVGELALQLVARQPAPLPEGEVRVLEGQLGQRRGPAGRRAPRRGPRSRGRARPSTSRRTRCGASTGAGVLGRPEPQQRARRSGPAREVERPARFFVGQAPRLAPRAPPPAGPRGRSAAARQGPGGAMTCAGWPSRSRKVVRSASCRRTTSPRTASRRAGDALPRGAGRRAC